MRKQSVLVIIMMVVTCFSFLMLNASFLCAKEMLWKMTSTWSPSINLIEADQGFVKHVNELCKGELQIKFYSGGSLMPPYEVFDAVRNGTVQAAGDWPNYWSGKNPVFDTLGSYPMGLTPVDYMIWIYEGGGWDIFQEAYGKFGMVYLPTGVTPSESGIRGNKSVKTAEDLKGLKVRMGGKAQGYILKKLGAAQVLLSGGEVYQALQKGTVDGAEFCSPITDWKMGLGEVTKYWIAPGWHQPASIMGVMINKESWDALSEETQQKVIAASKIGFLEFFCSQYYGCIAGTEKFVNKGVEIDRYDEVLLDKIEKIVNEYTEATAKKHPLFKKSMESQIQFRKDFAKWRTIEQPFSFGYNPSSYPSLGDK